MKVYLDMVGCRLNQSELETYARQFREAGHELVPYPQDADFAVMNTCTVTTAAAADSRKKIRWMRRAGVSKIIVTGCWSTMEPIAAARIPGVSQIIPNAEKDSLVQRILGISTQVDNVDHRGREPIPGERGRTRAFIKIQDGCDNRCTFCITTLARGQGWSRPEKEILDDIQYAIQGGSQEIVLTGVHIGSWGRDLEKPSNLQTLIKTILHKTNIPRLRLSSLEPWDIEEDFFDLWQDPRLMNHLHLPLQSGSINTLRRMGRKITPESYANLVSAARRSIKDVAITTDIITGFPGETEEEFQESIEFIHKMAFAHGHVFTFSEREGTVAARMEDTIPHHIRKFRSAQVRQLLARSENDFQKKYIGDLRPVLWEQAKNLAPAQWILSGLTDNYLSVTAHYNHSLWNKITEVQITDKKGRGLLGEIVE